MGKRQETIELDRCREGTISTVEKAGIIERGKRWCEIGRLPWTTITNHDRLPNETSCKISENLSWISDYW